MISQEDLSRIVPMQVHFDLETRVKVVEEQFFKEKEPGDPFYQLELCEKLRAKCEQDVLDSINQKDISGIDEKTDLLRRMDEVILRGIKRSEQPRVDLIEKRNAERDL